MQETNVAPFVEVEHAIEELRKGRMIILVDNEGRENEGDFVIAGEHATADAINIMVTRGRGMVCTPITPERGSELELAAQAQRNSALHGTNFTVSVDAVEGTTTGISTQDRARTVEVLCDPRASANDLARPGHMFPIIAQPGGVLERDGHTEAVVDMLRIAGMTPVGVICEILDDDGTMARLPRLVELANELDMSIARVDDVLRYRKEG
jgi:3,4-dihydroxy 2-butanone 4-phosphate synthase/GTP cyclohydrolase II